MKARARALRPRAALAAIIAAGAAAGCGRDAPQRDWEPAPAVTEDAAPRVVETASSPSDLPQFVTDPARFQVEERTIWDGRPSLGGAWAAHPEVEGQMMVEALNVDDGRRIRLPALRLLHRPGRPTLQLSAEAARALALRPGRPTVIRLTALAPVGADARPAADGFAETPAQASAAVETFEVDPVVEEATEASSGLADAPAPAQDAAEVPATAARPSAAAQRTGTAPAAGTETALPLPDAVRRAVQDAPAAPAPAEAPAPSADPASAPDPVPPAAAQSGASPAPQPEPAAEPLLTADPTADGPAASAAPQPRPGRAQASASAPPATAPAAAPDPEAIATAPYVQVGAFGQPQNAARTVARFEALGQPASLAPAGRLQRVLLGPFDRIEDAAAALDLARSEGFTDAYLAAR